MQVRSVYPLLLTGTGHDLVQCIKRACGLWFKARFKGKTFAQHSGFNWGDALNIPAGILRKCGITEFRLLVEESCDLTSGAKHVAGGWKLYVEKTLVADHNENLLRDSGIPSVLGG